LRTAVTTITENPWLGVGVSRGSDRFIAAPVVANLWLEIAFEGGIVALLAFAFGMTFTLWRWHAFEPRHRDIMIVLTLWLLIAWQFIATFPRLDLWIAFWVVWAWTRRGSERQGHSGWHATSWFVPRTPTSISSTEVARFVQLYPMNARPTQPLNGREIRTTP
jgi:hypothetical protein